MKFATVLISGRPCVCLVGAAEDLAWPVTALLPADEVGDGTDMRDFIHRWPAPPRDVEPFGMGQTLAPGRLEVPIHDPDVATCLPHTAPVPVDPDVPMGCRPGLAAVVGRGANGGGSRDVAATIWGYLLVCDYLPVAPKAAESTSWRGLRRALGPWILGVDAPSAHDAVLHVRVNGTPVHEARLHALAGSIQRAIDAGRPRAGAVVRSDAAFGIPVAPGDAVELRCPGLGTLHNTLRPVVPLRPRTPSSIEPLRTGVAAALDAPL